MNDQQLDPDRRARLELNSRGHQPDAEMDTWHALKAANGAEFDRKVAALPSSARTALHWRMSTYADLKSAHDTAVAAGVIEPTPPPAA